MFLYEWAINRLGIFLHYIEPDDSLFGPKHVECCKQNIILQ
jgi:hypothetical protein